MPRAASQTRSDDDTATGAVGPLERGLHVIEVLANADAGQRPADLARTTGLARSTVDRVVTTLEEIGYLRWDGREVLLTPRILELGNAYLAGSGLPDLLTSHASRLSDLLDESVSLAVPDGDAVRFISQSPRRRALSVAFRVGDLLPAERCAAGAVFAAHWGADAWSRWTSRVAADPTGARFPALPAVLQPGPADFHARAAAARQAGHATDDQLIEPGLIAVAVPVHDTQGAVVAALSVVSHTSRHTAASLREHVLAAMQACAGRMRQALATPPVPATASGAARGSDVKQRLGPRFLQSLDRGLAVLHALGSARGGLTLSEAAAATGLARATARRALLTLVQLGFVAEAGRRFVMQPHVLDLGYARLSGRSFEEIARPHIADLVDRVQDSASMAVLDGTDIRYVVRVPTVRIMRVAITLGTRFPAYATSMGRVLLAGLPVDGARQILAATDLRALSPYTRTEPADLLAAIAAAREDGYALVDQELEEGLRSLAVPIHDRSGQVVAAVNVASHAGRGTLAQTLHRLLPPLRATAAAIEEELAIFTERNALTLA
jgi:IclR family pca regulon transcriptional regulator